LWRRQCRCRMHRIPSTSEWRSFRSSESSSCKFDDSVSAYQCEPEDSNSWLNKHPKNMITFLRITFLRIKIIKEFSFKYLNTHLKC
jgi:hypothetical protein